MDAANIIRWTKFSPRPYQRDILKARANGVKRGLSIIHRRGGKDLTMVNMVSIEAMKRKGLYLYYFPTLKLAKQVIWKGMDRDGRRFLDYIPREIIKGEPNDTDLRMEFINGSILQLLGTDNLDVNVVGMNPVGVIYSEFPLQNPLAWELTRPILRENKGWAWFVYTPRGRNHGYRLYETARAHPETWFVQHLSIKDTRDIDGSPVFLESEVAQEVEEGMDPDLAQQEFYCSFDAPMQGSYYGRLLAGLYREKRIAPTKYDPAYGPVTCAWDIGRGDATAIWFAQFHGSDIRLVDYYENVSEGFDHYAKVVLEKPYIYERMILPHDAENKHFESRYSAEELAHRTFRERNITVTVLKKLDIEDGISAVRRFMPRFRIDEEKCGKVKYRGHTALDALHSYHKKWNDSKQEFDDEPHHNWASHCADALRYLALGIRDKQPQRVQTRYSTYYDPLADKGDDEYEHDFNPMTYDMERGNYAAYQVSE
jgi:phage terminase large subunit